MRVLLVLVALALAGCTSESDSYRLGGAFTADRTSEDMAEFGRITAEYSDDVAIMESFPEQFSIKHMHDGCEELRGKLLEKSYIATVSECELEP